MDEKKICFIICSNDETLLRECLIYIGRLEVPDGFSIDKVIVKGAESMTSGYNKGMRQSNAKYKIYMHQDVFIINKNILINIVSMFDHDEEIGAIGLFGYKTIASSGCMWTEERYGIRDAYGAKLRSYSKTEIQKYNDEISIQSDDVRVIDGCFFATSIDIEWDEEFDGWDFYDATQCMRLANAGRRIVVPKQAIPWIVHDDGMFLSLSNYNKYRKKYLNKYVNK